MTLGEPKGQVLENEACEFLKFIKHIEYSEVEQLNKMLSRISLLLLFLNSKPHRNTLMRILNETYVMHYIFMEKMDQLVENINTNTFVALNDDEIPSEGWGAKKALYIIVKCRSYILPDRKSVV